MAKKIARKKSTKKQKSQNLVAVPSIYAPDAALTGVWGGHEVLYPQTLEGVIEAVNISRGRETRVRSGQHLAFQDVVHDAKGVVINLSEMAAIDNDGDRVTVEAGATVSDVARYLAERGLALPLPSNPILSMASAVIHEQLSCLTRTLGTLENHLLEVELVKQSGQSSTFFSRNDLSGLDLARGSNALLARAVLKADPTTNLWLLECICPYSSEQNLLDLCSELFVTPAAMKNADLLLDVYSGAYDIPVVRICAACGNPDDRAALEQQVQRALDTIEPNLRKQVQRATFTGNEVTRFITERGPTALLDPAIRSVRIEPEVALSDGDWMEFLKRQVARVHQGVEAGLRQDQKEGSYRLSVRFQLNFVGSLSMVGYEYTALPIENITVREFFRDNEATRTRLSRPFHFEIPTLSFVQRGPIPNFHGRVYEPNDLSYPFRAHQYASSSYPGQLKPFMLAYPRDVKDIAAALSFARVRGKRIVARSGGHHYSGLSSGGQDCIVLCMDLFDDISISGNIATVGVAVRLSEFALRLRLRNLTVPHGECPFVAVGGHAQTGGYGHLMRSFGLTLDYVQAIEIVLADGTAKTLVRPPEGQGPSTPDEELFWGVLGGNAGSFGIVTKYRFECIDASEYPNSYGFSAKRFYSKERLTRLMREVQSWTKQVADGTLPAGLDFMVTVRSKSLLLPVDGILVELVYANLGKEGEVVDGEATFRSIIDAAAFDDEELNLTWLTTDSGPASLSVLSDSFVRRFGTTLDGREFSEPYKKRVNITYKALSDDFLDAFVTLVDRVVKGEPGIKLIFQMGIGGGKYQNNPRRPASSIPHRDMVFCVIFDLFYDKGFEERASAIQTEMQELVNTKFSPEQEHRFFWGSFGKLDLDDPAIRDMYYDDQATYQDLQNLKKRVDKHNLFRTGLTVRLPNSP